MDIHKYLLARRGELDAEYRSAVEKLKAQYTARKAELEGRLKGSTDSRSSRRRPAGSRSRSSVPEPASLRRPRRPVNSISALIDGRIVSVLLRDGFIPSSQILEILGAARLGPIMSAWHRSARSIGYSLGMLIFREPGVGGAEAVYRITQEGREVLPPGAKPPESPTDSEG